MGYWSTCEHGHSFCESDEDQPEMIWGDEPADLMGDALAEIFKAFQRDVGRMPTIEEVIGGVKFSWGTTVKYHTGRLP